MTSSVFRGRAVKLGDNIDTDNLAPNSSPEILGLSREDANRVLAAHCCRAVRPDLHRVVRQGDILIAGRSFGLGSHRERANMALAALGFRAVVADSIARIFFRTSIALGFYAFEVPGVSCAVQEGNELELDLQAWELRDLTNGTEFRLTAYTDLLQRIVNAGGIVEVLKQRSGSGTADS